MYINVNDTIDVTDSRTINNAIKKAKETGKNKVLIPKENKRTKTNTWVIDEAISVPSNIEILLDGAYLVLADNCYTPIFATENFIEGKAYDMENIKIHGKNGAVLDGGNYNGLNERNHSKEGRPHVILNTTCLFCHGKNITLTDLKIVNYRYWAVTLVYTTHSEIRNIEFESDSSSVDENGIRRTDRLPETYEEIYGKNVDGITLRLGCNNIKIENITGFTMDDTVVLSTVRNTFFKCYPYLDNTEKNSDIFNIEIRNIYSDPYTTSNIRLLAEDGYKIHDIYIDDVKDTRSKPSYCAKSTVRIGDMLFGDKPSKFGDIYNLVIKNINSQARTAVSVCKSLKDSLIENINYFGDGVPFAVLQNADVENVNLRNIYKNSDINFYEATDIYTNIRNLDKK